MISETKSDAVARCLETSQEETGCDRSVTGDYLDSATASNTTRWLKGIAPPPPLGWGFLIDLKSALHTFLVV